MPRVAVGGIVVGRQAALGSVAWRFAARERQQRANQPAAPARGDSGEPGGRTAPQPSQQDRLDLIVFVMRSHDVLRAAAFLHFTEPGISRAPRFGLRRIGPEAQLGELEW